MSRKEKKNNAFPLILLPQKKNYNNNSSGDSFSPPAGGSSAFPALMKQSDVNLRVEVNFLRGTTEDKHAVGVCRTGVWGG